MINLYYYETEIGKIGIAENGIAITDLFFVNEHEPLDSILEETDLLKNASKQLREYLEGRRFCFDLPIKTEGTEFQLKVWKALESIPYGQTRSYKQIAEMVGRPKAYRAVGMANNKNPISIIIPCHRVIGANGDLVGYGSGLDKKDILLRLEKENVQ